MSREKEKGKGMAQRKDGIEKRRRILTAACRIFAEKGYHAASVADICRWAGANVAAVNYYFGDKATLYAEAWQTAYEKRLSPEFTEADNVAPEEQLRLFIHSLIQHFTEHGSQGEFTRLYLKELANPTGLISNLWHKLIEPRRQVLLNIIRNIMGATANNDEAVLFCEVSIVNQCRTLSTLRRSDLEYLLDQPLSSDLITRLGDHIADFSLAGIKAVAENKP
ncbi:MAG: CerR family C-terminal domain-containing protein [Pseudomonadota bacterium]|nr:CerR family C-terminal domain-containing protein [Pseudomonadota bacterium]